MAVAAACRSATSIPSRQDSGVTTVIVCLGSVGCDRRCSGCTGNSLVSRLIIKSSLLHSSYRSEIEERNRTGRDREREIERLSEIERWRGNKSSSSAFQMNNFIPTCGHRPPPVTVYPQDSQARNQFRACKSPTRQAELSALWSCATVLQPLFARVSPHRRGGAQISVSERRPGKVR